MEGIDITLNEYRWKPGESGNPKGRPRRNRLLGVWSEPAARRAFLACSTEEQRRKVASIIYGLATSDKPPRWCLRAICEAGAADWSVVQRTGHLPRRRVYVGA